MFLPLSELRVKAGWLSWAEPQFFVFLFVSKRSRIPSGMMGVRWILDGIQEWGIKNSNRLSNPSHPSLIRNNLGATPKIPVEPRGVSSVQRFDIQRCWVKKELALLHGQSGLLTTSWHLSRFHWSVRSLSWGFLSYLRGLVGYHCISFKSASTKKPGDALISS